VDDSTRLAGTVSGTVAGSGTSDIFSRKQLEMRIISATEDEEKPVRKSIPTLKTRQIVKPKKTSLSAG
jgi:hypothetical protein